MNRIKKVLAITVTLLTISIYSQPLSSEKKAELTEINVLNSMNHEIETVAESAIFNLMLLKNRYPLKDITIYTDELSELSVNGKTAIIKYKAQLTYWYLTNKNNIGKIEFNGNYEANKYYNELADKLQSNLIAVK